MDTVVLQRSPSGGNWTSLPGRAMVDLSRKQTDDTINIYSSSALI